MGVKGKTICNSIVYTHNQSIRERAFGGLCWLCIPFPISIRSISTRFLLFCVSQLCLFIYLSCVAELLYAKCWLWSLVHTMTEPFLLTNNSTYTCTHPITVFLLVIYGVCITDFLPCVAYMGHSESGTLVDTAHSLTFTRCTHTHLSWSIEANAGHI